MIVEGETPKYTEEETPKLSKGATPTMFAEGEIPENSEGDEIPVIVDTQEPREEGLKVIVDLVDAPEDEDSPIKRKEFRRRIRSLLDEVDNIDQTQEPR